MDNLHNKSLGNDMPKVIKCLYYTVTLFVNAIWNKVPSRHMRKWAYQIFSAAAKSESPRAHAVVLFPVPLLSAVPFFLVLLKKHGFSLHHAIKLPRLAF